MGRFVFKSRAPFISCPKCHKKAYGVLNIADVFYVRRCNDCDYSQRYKLPKPNKQLVYLDQFAISFDAKIDSGRSSHPKWAKVKELIGYALHMEAIVCPYSEFHENESAVCVGLSDDLRKTYKHFAHGESFKPTVYIELAQIARALRRYTKEPLGKHDVQGWRDVLNKDPNSWTSDIYFTMNTEEARKVTETALQVKEQISQSLEALNNEFSESKKTFEEQFPMELRQVGVNMMRIYTNDIAKLLACKTPAEMIHVKMNGSVFAEQMEYILKYFSDRGADSKGKFTEAVSFLQSKEFFDLDYVRIGAALWAGLARRVGIGQARVKYSDYNDVPIISHYAPYCGAMLIDDCMRDLLVTNPVRDTLNLKTKFFSPNCFDEFCEYLGTVVSSQPGDFRTAVSEVHGEKESGTF